MQRDAAGVAAERYSLGWAAAPLHSFADAGKKQEQKQQAGSGAAAVGDEGCSVFLTAAQVVAGTPRYLLYRWVGWLLIVGDGCGGAGWLRLVWSKA